MDRYLEGGDNRKTQADLKYTALHIYQFVVYRNEISVRIFYSPNFYSTSNVYTELYYFRSLCVKRNKYHNGASL